MPDSDYKMDFFVSHADADIQWAEWITAELENAGYGVIVKAWDFRPGENSLAKHDEALAICRHTLCVLSPAYVESEIATRTAAHYQALEGKARALIPVQVAACPVPPMMGPVIQIDLSDVDEEEEARRLLLAGVAGQAPRVAHGGFPKSRAAQFRFPGARQEVWELRGHRSDSYFIGRDDELAMLHRAFRAGSPTAAVQVITGLGGLGKTRLATEYAFRHAAAYDTVWWIRAEDPATMRGDYVELAQALALPSENDDQAIAALRRELRRRRDWLLIFDNAEAPSDLFSLLPERHPGHVLITSRRRQWPHAETHHIDVLSTQAAVKYLQRRGGVADADTARNLGEAVGRLPLALVQAASIIDDGMPATDYLDLLHKQSPQLFAEGHVADHELTIDSTWRVSVDRLAHRSPAALALFRLAAFLGADSIPLARLSATTLMPTELNETLTDPFQLNKATRALGEYSLGETVSGLLSIHRMVQAVTRAELGDDAPHWANLALTTIDAAFPSNVEDPRGWEDHESVLAHALACAGHATRLRVDPKLTVQLLNRVARYLLARGRLDATNAVLGQALGAAERLHHDDPVHLSYRHIHGLLLIARGDLSAQTVLEEVYRSRTQILGPEDPDTLRAGRDLVEALYDLGHRKQATQLQDQLVEAFTAILGPDDLETITSLAYQATLVRNAGNYAQARAIEEQVLDVRSRALGEDHPDTLTAKSNLASTLYGLGEVSRARTMEEQVLEARIRVQGEDHPSTLGAKGNLASTLYRLGEVSRACTMDEQVLEARIRVQGEDHPSTLSAKGRVAAMLFTLGDLSRCRTMEEQVLASSIQVLGEDHPVTLIAKSSLADTLRAQKELSQARAMDEQVLEARIRVLGEDHPDTLEAKGKLAETLRAQKELSRARAMEEQVLEASVLVLGEDHPDTLEAKGKLAATLRAQKQLSRAHAMQEEVLASSIRMLGEVHMQTSMAKFELATTLYEQGEKNEANSLLSESLKISFRVFGKKHASTTQAAWQLLTNFEPHETEKRNAIILPYLSWLSNEPPGHLTATQKEIKDGLKGFIHGSPKKPRPKKPRPKKPRPKKPRPKKPRQKKRK